MPTDQLISNKREQDSIRIWLELTRCTKLLEGRISTNMRKAFGQSFSRFDVMSQLYRADKKALAVTSLASQLLASGSKNITGLIDRMEKNGLVLRSPHPSDRRSFTVSLTEKGTTVFEEMAIAHGHWVNESLQELADDSLNDMMTSMTLLRKSIETSD